MKDDAERGRIAAARVRTLARLGYGVDDIRILTKETYHYIGLCLRTVEAALRPAGELASRRAQAERRRAK